MGKHELDDMFSPASTKLHYHALMCSLSTLFHSSIARMSSSSPYELRPLKVGMEVYGISLDKSTSDSVKDQIIKDVAKHRILVFRNQSGISPQKHLEISQWVGEIESTFYDHPKSPDRDIFRVSNDRNEGCTGVGRTGWHIDGSFQLAPFTHSLYHIISVPDKGDTVFAPLTDLINGLSADQYKRCNRLWMMSDRRERIIHPLIYHHPTTKKQVLCVHLGMTEGYMWDYGSKQQRVASEEEFDAIQREIHHEFVKNNKAIQYSHKWKKGDFIISDNLAVGHEAHPDTQLSRSQVGLRVMHRTTIKGTIPPTKLAHAKREEL